MFYGMVAGVYCSASRSCIKATVCTGSRLAATFSRSGGAKKGRGGRRGRRQLDGAAVGGAGPRGKDEGMVQILQIAAAAAAAVAAVLIITRMFIAVQTRTKGTSLLLLQPAIVFNIRVDVANGRSGGGKLGGISLVVVMGGITFATASSPLLLLIPILNLGDARG